MGIALAELIQRHPLCSHRFRSYLPALIKSFQLWHKHHWSYSLFLSLSLSFFLVESFTVKTKKINNIKTINKTTEIETDRSHTPHFRIQDSNWDEWCNILDNNLSQFISPFPNEVSKNITDAEANLFFT